MKRLGMIWDALLGRPLCQAAEDEAYEGGMINGRYDALNEVDKILSDASIPHHSTTQDWGVEDWETLADEFAQVATRVSELER